MATCDIDTLKEQACDSGFSCLSKKQLLVVIAQELCNLSGGVEPECINVIPDGAVYITVGPDNVYQQTVVAGETYTVTFGIHEISLTNGVSEIVSSGDGDTVTFVAEIGYVLFIGTGLGETVTATLCLI